MALLTRKRLTVIPLLIYWPAIFILTHIPIPSVVYRARVSDKILHILAYMILTFLFWFAISPDSKVNWRRRSVWLILLAMIAYSGVDEWLQGRVGRSCDMLDFIANAVGGLAGLLIFTFFSVWPAFLILTGTVIFLLKNVAKANPAELVPVTDALFHLLGYAAFTGLWAYNVLALKPNMRRIKYMVSAVAIPVVFLLAVELFSVRTGRYVNQRDIILSAAGIIFVIIIAAIKWPKTAVRTEQS